MIIVTIVENEQKIYELKHFHHKHESEADLTHEFWFS